MKLKNFWCWVCENVRTHAMITEELGTCTECHSRNYAPTGDID